MTTVVITGAAGNIGTKLRRHFSALGWTLRLLDAQAPDPAVQVADLATWSDSWAEQFHDADAVIHLAADPEPAGELGTDHPAQFRPHPERVRGGRPSAGAGG